VQQLFDESIAGQTWVARALNLSELPPIEAPWPPWLQSGKDADYSVYLPDAIGGEIAAAEAFVNASRALELAEAPPRPGPPSPILAEHGCSHSSYRLAVVGGGAPVPVYSGSRQRGYSLVVNVGAQEVFIAYGRDAEPTSGLSLVSGGVGFHELVFGTRSSLSVCCPNAAGSQIEVIDGDFDPPHLPEY
jgi:hypothetical protein